MNAAGLRRAATGLAAVWVLLAGGGVARADAGWFESGDALLRSDLQLLNDAAIIRLPVNQWPLPRAAVEYALHSVKDEFAGNAAVAAALARVRARVARAAGGSFGVSVVGGDAARLRQFDTPGRGDGELTGSAEYADDRFAVGLAASAVSDPQDDQTLRLDGSHATVQLGNWLFSANALERYWGPSHESSLILSNNARPMPTFMIERAAAKPFESSLLNWLGPWRFSFGVSRMESERVDVDKPLFMAWRVAIMPFHDIELGFSRTAQFCGEELECDLKTFGNMLAGNDNVGIDATPENEPGNQMAGFDIRWASPIGNLPYAVYSQMIGEDESSYLPAKYLSQFGVEAWKPFGSGAILQGFLEYSSTTCSANSSRGPYYNCAYNQGRFYQEGYRYRGRVIGYTTDRDSESYALGATLARANGQLFSATARTSRLNRDDFDDDRDTVSSVPADYTALELDWRGRAFGGDVSIEVGVESYEPNGGSRDVSPFGFARWTYDLTR